MYRRMDLCHNEASETRALHHVPGLPYAQGASHRVESIMLCFGPKMGHFGVMKPRVFGHQTTVLGYEMGRSLVPQDHDLVSWGRFTEWGW